MKIDSNFHVTIADAAAELGTSRRAIYRMIQRAEAAGETGISVEAFGRTFLVKSKLSAMVKKYYFPHGSELRSKRAKEWGAMGGTQKRINREKEANA